MRLADTNSLMVINMWMYYSNKIIYVINIKIYID